MTAVASQSKATALPPLPPAVFNYPSVQFNPPFSPSTPTFFPSTPTLSVKKTIQKPKKLRRVSDAVKNTQKLRKLRDVSDEEKNTQNPRQHRGVTDYIKIEPLYNPDAITAYHYNDSKKHPKDLINNAKKHLSSVGWSFYNIQKTVDKKEIRYESPSGRVYISLKAACKAYIADLPIVTGPIHDRHDSVPESVPESRRKDEVEGVSAVQFLARYAHFRFFHTFAFIIWLLNS